jgi:hypothetical protein
MTEQKEGVLTHQEETTEAAEIADSGSMFTEAELEDLRFTDQINNPDYNPDEAVNAEAEAKAQAEAAAKQKEMAHEMTAFMAIESFEGLLRSMSHPRFKLDEETKKTALERYKPLIEKYGTDALGIFGQYQAEIMAGLFTVTLVKGSMSQIKDLKAEDAENARQQKAAELARRQAANEPTQQAA